MAERDQKKTEVTEVQTAKNGSGKGDVFDKLGNDALKEKVAEVQAQNGKAMPKESEDTVLRQASEKMAETQQKSVLKAEEAPELQAEDALRQQALEARDEVTLNLQQLSGTPDQLKIVQGATSIGQASAQVIEFLVQGMPEADLAALAAYDHEDLMSGRILSPESWLETRGLSTQAQRLGQFAPILWQMVADQLQAAGLKFEEDEEMGADFQGAVVDASGDPRNLSSPLLRVASELRAASSTTIVL